MLETLVRFGLEEKNALDILWAFSLNVLSAIGAVLLICAFYFFTAHLLEAALRKTSMQESLINITVRSLYRGVVIIVGLIIILGQLGINVTAAVAGVGVLGLAVGFAAQQTLANIFSGFGIFADKLFASGDWVKIADNYGEIMTITLRTTKIRTLDNTYVSIPNSLVTSSPVINYSAEGMLRITARVNIAYKESVDAAREALINEVSKIKGIKKNPPPVVVVDKLGESGVQLLVRMWVDDAGAEQKYFFLLTETCKQALDKANISIPFPQRDIHIIQEPVKKQITKKK